MMMRFKKRREFARETIADGAFRVLATPTSRSNANVCVLWECCLKRNAILYMKILRCVSNIRRKNIMNSLIRYASDISFVVCVLSYFFHACKNVSF